MWGGSITGRSLFIHPALVEGGGFEPPKLTRQIYSLIPLAAREPLQKEALDSACDTHPCQTKYGRKHHLITLSISKKAESATCQLMSGLYLPGTAPLSRPFSSRHFASLQCLSPAFRASEIHPRASKILPGSRHFASLQRLSPAFRASAKCLVPQPRIELGTY